jgi:hypothetical protein
MTFVVDLKKALKAANYKPGKRSILEIVDRMIGVEVEEKDVHELIGSCFRYFEPWPTAKAVKDDFIWVASAASNDHTKKSIFHPWTIAKYLCATDGHRLHMAPVGELSLKKCYDKTKQVVFGDIDGVDEEIPPDVIIFLENHRRVGTKFLATRSSFEDQDKIQTQFMKRLFDKKYINDVFVKPDVKMAVWLPVDLLGPVYFENSTGRMAWVMPRKP